MHALTVVAAFLSGGAAVTLIGAKLIERVHPPYGRFLKIGGLRQHVVELGDGAGVVNGPAIVLLHGAGCNLEDMRLALGERLADRHSVILLDRPGLGWSERRSSNGSSPAYQAAMLSAVLDRLGVDRVILVGHSWGGLLALTFALDYPHRPEAPFTKFGQGSLALIGAQRRREMSYFISTASAMTSRASGAFFCIHALMPAFCPFS